MAVKKVNADLEVAGTVIGDGVNLNTKIALLENLIPDEPLPLNALEFENTTPAIAGVAQAAGANYAYGINPGDENVPNCINMDVPFFLTVDDDRFGKADQGELRLFINEVLEETLNLETDDTGTAILLVSKVTYNNFEPWKKGQARVRIGPVYGTALVGGANKVRLEHWIDGALYGYGDIILFYDSGTDGVSMLSAESFVNVPTEPGSPAYLSGVKFIPLGGEFEIKVTLENVFQNTFKAVPLSLIGGNSGITNADIAYSQSDPNLSGFSDPPVSSENFVYQNTHSITLEKFSTDAKIQCTGGDPWQSFSAQNIPVTGDAAILVDSLSVHQSTETRELFTDEYYRLPLGEMDNIPGQIAQQWTSSSPLTNGNAQVFGALIYPETDFSAGHFPATGQPDYSIGFTGDQKYLRAIRENNVPHNSGTLRLDELTLSDIEPSGEVKVEIKLPTQTGWLDLGMPYNAGTFTGADGDGCRTGVENGDEFSWTAGQFSTADSGWMIMVRITLKNTNAPALNEMREIGWEG